MKKILLITLLSLATMANAQTTKPIEGFLGMKFGSTQAEVSAGLKAKGGKLMSNPTSAKMSFSDLKVAGKEATQVTVKFIDGKAYEASMFFKPQLDARCIEEYEEWVKTLNNIYGSGRDYTKFKAPYEKGDGYEITAIKTGNADYMTYWRQGEDAAIGVSIQLLGDDNIYVVIEYLSIKMGTKANQQEAEKNKADL